MMRNFEADPVRGLVLARDGSRAQETARKQFWCRLPWFLKPKKIIFWKNNFFLKGEQKKFLFWKKNFFFDFSFFGKTKKKF